MKKYGTNLGKIVVGESNFITLSEPTLVVARRTELISGLINKIFLGLEASGDEIQKIVFGGSIAGAKCFVTEDEINKGMVEVYNYIKTVSTFLKLNRCKNIEEYNQKFRKSGARLVVVVEDLEKLSRMENYSKFEAIINFLITKATDTGVMVIATTSQIERLAMEENLFYKFSNRLVFGGFSGDVVNKLTLGMYHTTKGLNDSEFYYMTMNKGNGSLLEL